MVFRIIIALLVLAGAYAVWQIWQIKNYYNDMADPKASFMVVQEGNHSGVQIVEFLNYDCSYCRATHKVLMDYAKANPETRYVVRPVPFGNGYAEESAEMAIAAGIQGHFQDFSEAILNYQLPPDEAFYRETANLYDIDYERMLSDVKEDEVLDIAGDNATAALRANLKTVPAFMIGKTVYQLDKILTLQDLIRMVEDEKVQ
ncbi:MAG: hypothetical protein DI551_04555 [Micavibrio aeruginosavorus]|uniref:Thioredoxin-like fold domain-containing protein n=1 Tax=Micavibrio aeruginosavorus TaxID=349221 RepID=A0A2W5N269_9BACT|nr:MAG: hypothetical protein DI551_04555 [Micavibrio aeruginosavorus]